MNEKLASFKEKVKRAENAPFYLRKSKAEYEEYLKKNNAEIEREKD